MQKMNKKELQTALNERNGWQVWWRLLRPHTLTASFIPVFVGTMIAAIDGSFHVGLFVAMLLASILIQAATNMFNEYYDYVRGLDNEQSIGIGGAIVRDGIPPKKVLGLAIAFFLVSMLLGVYISASTSWWIALIGLISMGVGYLYTGGPLPIAYTPLGELVSGFFMGPVIIGISYFIQAGFVHEDVWWISIPVGIFIGAILLANNIRDRVGDAENGRKTLAILFGHKGAVLFLGFLFGLAYLLTGLYILLGILPIWSLIVVLSMKKARDAVHVFSTQHNNPLQMLPAMKYTAQTNTFYGFLLGISLLLQYLIPFTI
ncbi:1,4-dihydroxy-2-naphthoate prenyltransferase [Pontibacillus halophilus JSM 076056 = DSM 19796]|uniref:1,4-dihydroxy-2-naphthoate octaprenyltransferase n=1 Tax=Pontibacillus halophilus JSM 076056 = DSM 19796 TaxID=1385510 RepID=A0A0A5I109_9BACI|nr:1,4-dihydroxy-2-naphthoate prenyltransferase [Pontibacillus halophilus JSM 076056 = DSM 19796]